MPVRACAHGRCVWASHLDRGLVLPHLYRISVHWISGFGFHSHSCFDATALKGGQCHTDYLSLRWVRTLSRASSQSQKCCRLPSLQRVCADGEVPRDTGPLFFMACIPNLSIDVYTIPPKLLLVETSILKLKFNLVSIYNFLKKYWFIFVLQGFLFGLFFFFCLFV